MTCRLVGWLLCTLVVVAGCVSSSKTYGPDGREIHVLNCSGPGLEVGRMVP
jgi:hypothetical protein